MTKSQEKKFLLIALSILIIIVAIIYGPNFLEKLSAPSDIGKENIMTNDELIITDLEIGSGPEVKAGDTISIHYHGTLQDGTVFDSSVQRGTPFETTIGVGQVIVGWDEGVPGMKVGGKRQLIIPPSKAYGNRTMGDIPANSTLIFDVELLDILSP
jgi:peptidylprolyl isomerase